MRTRTIVMFALVAVAAILWALKFLPGAGMPVDLSDFFGGMAIGLFIAAAITWAGERGPAS